MNLEKLKTVLEKTNPNKIDEIDFHPTKKKLVGAGIDENRAVVYNPRMIRAFIKQVEKKFPKYKGEIQQADEPDEIVFPNDPKLINFFKGAREVKFVLSDSVEESTELTEEIFNMFFGGYDSDWSYLKQDAKKMRAKITNVETQFGGDYYFTIDTTKSNLKKLLKKYGDLELEESITEAVKPEDFVKGGNDKIVKREVDKLIGKIFMNNKLSKEIEKAKAYVEGLKGKVKKNPYKKDTVDFHLFILGQQVAETD